LLDLQQQVSAGFKAKMRHVKIQQQNRRLQQQNLCSPWPLFGGSWRPSWLSSFHPWACDHPDHAAIMQLGISKIPLGARHGG
jgi:hypothetical protein